MIQPETSVTREVTQQILELLIEKEIQTKDLELIFNQIREIVGTTVIAPTNKKFLLPGEYIQITNIETDEKKIKDVMTSEFQKVHNQFQKYIVDDILQAVVSRLTQ